MKHIYINKESNDTIIILHGTGGNEEEMLPLAKEIDAKANILSIRGNVIENGMYRYFKWFKPGVYDLENYKLETNNLILAIKDFSEKYNFSLKNATLVGFSNGANIILGVIQTNPLIDNYILYSPDYINLNEGFNSLTNKNIFISTAENDPYVNYSNILLLINRLKEVKANVEVLNSSGHQINMVVLESSINWYNNIK